MTNIPPKLSNNEAGAEICPSRDVLADLTLGKLPLETIEILGQHVETCAVCQTILESLDGLEDPLIADIKAWHFGAASVDPWLEQQIRAAEQIMQTYAGQLGISNVPLGQATTDS